MAAQPCDVEGSRLDHRHVALSHPGARLLGHRPAPDDRPGRLRLDRAQLERRAGERDRPQRHRRGGPIHVRDRRRFRHRARRAARRATRGGAERHRDASESFRPRARELVVPQPGRRQDLPRDGHRVRDLRRRTARARRGRRGRAQRTRPGCARAQDAAAARFGIRRFDARATHPEAHRARRRDLARGRHADRRAELRPRGRSGDAGCAAHRNARRRGRRRRTHCRTDRRVAPLCAEPSDGAVFRERPDDEQRGRRRDDRRRAPACRSGGRRRGRRQAARPAVRARRPGEGVTRPCDRAGARRLVARQRRVPDSFRLGDRALRDNPQPARTRPAGAAPTRARRTDHRSNQRPADRARAPRVAGRTHLGRDEGVGAAGLRRRRGRAFAVEGAGGVHWQRRAGRVARGRAQRRIDLSRPSTARGPQPRTADVRLAAVDGAGGSRRYVSQSHRTAARARQRCRCADGLHDEARL